jgi:hypothetical protein
MYALATGLGGSDGASTLQHATSINPTPARLSFGGSREGSMNLPQ